MHEQRRPALRLLALPAALVAGLAQFASPPAAQAAPGTQVASRDYGYPYPSAPDCVETPGVTTGCVHDRWQFFQGQCVSWVAHRLSTYGGLTVFHNTRWRATTATRWGSAGNWDDKARGLGLPVNQTPRVGAVAQWGARVGHVAYVEKVNPDGSIVVSEMNAKNHNEFSLTRLARGDRRWPDSFIHFADRPADLGGDSMGDLVTIRPGGQLDYRAGSSAAPAAPVQTSSGWARLTLASQADDLTGDGRRDVVTRAVDGSLLLYASRGDGRLASARRVGTGWAGVSSLVPVGTLGGGSARYLLATRPDGSLWRHRWSTTAGFGAGTRIGSGWAGYRLPTSVGDVTGDGRTDVVAVRASTGELVMWPGTASATLGRGRVVGTGWGAVRSLASPGDLGGTRTAELVALNSTGSLTAYRWSGGVVVRNRTLVTGLPAGTRLV